jgi:hypothetical protein
MELQQLGTFIVSLDFELHWGIRDLKSIEAYRENLLGARSAIPRLLAIFDAYGIRATWAIVGLLFFRNRAELIAGLPTIFPSYTDPNLSPYTALFSIGDDEMTDPFHYAHDLITAITAYPGQEIATHTFSHYYCLEPGQSSQAFNADLQAAFAVARRFGLEVESLVFPRHQFNQESLDVCKSVGITAIRGNEKSWCYTASSGKRNTLFKRAMRMLDTYINLSGHNCYSVDTLCQEIPINLPSSRFLRPYSRRLKALEPLRFHRIISGLTHAAQEGLLYHLWWHPHNYGVNQEENFGFLTRILDHYSHVRDIYGMQSCSMRDVTRLCQKGIAHDKA